MRHIVSAALIVLTLAFSACSHKKNGKNVLSHEDSIKVFTEKVLKAHLKDLEKVHENFIGLEYNADEDPTVKKGVKFKTSILDDSTKVISEDFEKLKAKLAKAQKDSTTAYGILLTRFRLLDTQQKYLTATYTEEAHILRFTSEISFDDKHEEERDFYFNNGVLVYFREWHIFTVDEQDYMTDDSYFIRNGKVIYSYRDEGSAPQIRDKMHLLSPKRYALLGNVTAHVAREYHQFLSDYEILMSQPLEPLIYPGDPYKRDQ